MADENPQVIPTISSITLPSGNTYYIKDATARAAIAALEGGSYFLGVTTTTLYDQATTSPITLTKTDPETGNPMVVEPQNGNIAIYGNKEFIFDGTTWNEFGDLTNMGALAYLDQIDTTTAKVLGTGTTFTNSSSAVTFTGGATDVALGEATTFTATGANTAWNSKDQKTVVTGYASPTTDTFVKSVSAETNKKLVTTSIVPTNGTDNASLISNKVDGKLVTTSITGVSGSTTASKATAATSQTTADGTTTSHQGTSSSPQATYNTYMLGDVSVSNETLSIKGLTLDTQTTTQQTFTDVTVPTAAPSATTVATGSISSTGTGADVVQSFTATAKTLAKVGTATTVATGATDATGGGDAIVTGVTIGDSASAITGLGTASTANVIGASSTFTITQPTVNVGTNDKVAAVTSIGAGTAAAQTITVTKSEVDAVTSVTAVQTSTP